ncbi:hypothetical protein L1887_43459 [Cichorium endivia]|nr:hypothetical protein L1887_43459 [Cichorium endivia]
MMVQVTHRLSSSASAIVGRFRKQCTQSRTPEGPNKNASRSPRPSEVGACGMNRPSLMRERTHKADGPSFLHFICAPTAATACTHGASARSTDAPAAVLASSSHLLLQPSQIDGQQGIMGRETPSANLIHSARICGGKDCVYFMPIFGAD